MHPYASAGGMGMPPYGYSDRLLERKYQPTHGNRTTTAKATKLAMNITMGKTIFPLALATKSSDPLKHN